MEQLDKQSQIVLAIAVALVANVHLKLVPLPENILSIISQNKIFLALSTVGLTFYNVKFGVISAALLYVALNTSENMTDKVEEKTITDQILEVVGISNQTEQAPEDTIENQTMAPVTKDEVVGMTAKPSLEPSVNPLLTQVNDAPLINNETSIPQADLTVDVDETKFDVSGMDTWDKCGMAEP